MLIETQPTPNPATLKFLPGRTVLEAGSADFTDAESAAASPLAEALFAVDGVTGVFFGGDFITVTKQDDQDWQALKPILLGEIMQHFTTGAPIMREGADTAAAEMTVEEGDEEVVTQIKQLLDEKVRPAVAQDGGDIVFHGYKEGIVHLTMMGACAGCPSSTWTLKNGIENLLRYYIPEVTEVRPVM